jgi:D-threo-aldose 1-dehydrogenase
MRMKTRKFVSRNGAILNFTELGLGTAPLGNLYRSLSEKEANATLESAWDAGCRVFDTAPLYGLGLAETRLNGFLREKPRDSFILSTKVGRLLAVCPQSERSLQGKFFNTPSRREIFDYSYDGVMRSLEASFERLGLDTIDIVLCHDVDVFTHGSREASDHRVAEFMEGGYKALHQLRTAKVIKAFGAGVNEWPVAETLARAGDFDVFLLAGRYTLLEQESLQSFLPYCEERNIGILLGGPFNSGILATGPRPGAFYNYDPAPRPIFERVARIERICRAHGVKLAEAALRFPLGHKQVLCVLPGAQKPLEVRRNADMLTKRIPAALWRDLKHEGLMRKDARIPK